MALPILLCVTALIVNLGSAVVWRVRGEVVSREAVWRARWPRTGVREGPPSFWPVNATMTVTGSSGYGVLDHPDLRHPVVRGPLPNGFGVRPYLDPNRGGLQGAAAVTRRYPLLPRLGHYSSGEIQHALMDGKWPCHQMGTFNFFPRAAALYQLPTTEQAYPEALDRASQGLFRMRRWYDLAVLDDVDVSRHCKCGPDFYPRVAHPYPAGRLVDVGLCRVDPAEVRRGQVNRIVDARNADGKLQLGEISYLPRTLTNAYLAKYRAEITVLTAQIELCLSQLKSKPPPSASTGRRLQREIRQARLKIKQIEVRMDPLKQYEKRLPQIESDLQRSAAQSGV